MKKILSLSLAAILMLCAALPAMAQEDYSIANILYQRTTLHGDASPYDTAPLDDDIVSLLLSAGFSAPTGGNQRSLNFFVITERERMDKIREGHPYSTPLLTAPLVVVIAGDEANCRYPELHEMDAGLAAMAMMVQATEIGLSSCVMSIYPQDERVNAVRASVDMPETFKPVLMVAFGYPAADVVAGASVDNYNEAQVHMNGYEGSFDVEAVSSPTAVVE
ncbi:MAG: nitroreductase family protein [Clostridia bacterium]|nr:nitroreductase family protein [Clostridia bacterium]